VNEYVIAAMAILALIWAIFMVRRTLSKQANRKKDHKFPEPVMQTEANKPVNNPVLDTESKKETLPEPQVEEPLCSTEPDSKLIVESQTYETNAQVQQGGDEGIPQDFMLRRHYLTNLRAMIESPESTRPIEPLICNYEDSVAHCENPKLPEDSMLRRHAITNLYAIVESDMPLRPTDSVLRRHYDTMIKAEVNKLLGCKIV